MIRNKYAGVGLFVFTITANGAALATCPNSMPLELLVDCIVYERAGSSFPTSDYANMDRYQEWLKTQRQGTTFPPDSSGLSKGTSD